jgi:ParB-like chromosome segregation protein Spo0J
MPGREMVMLVSQIKPNPNNPRLIKDDKFKKLVQSIKDFPDMLNKRPIVVNKDMIVLGGNMRLKACIEAGMKDVPVIVADWSEEQQREFIIKDNVSGGEWDWDVLANEWDADQLTEWGLDVPIFEQSGDIIELPDITTTFNINIKCDNPEKLEEMKFKLGITSNSIHSTMLLGLLA